ncbi:hypothetical protein Tco_0012607 [Tanacetum coccineum]
MIEYECSSLALEKGREEEEIRSLETRSKYLIAEDIRLMLRLLRLSLDRMVGVVMAARIDIPILCLCRAVERLEAIEEGSASILDHVALRRVEQRKTLTTMDEFEIARPTGSMALMGNLRAANALEAESQSQNGHNSIMEMVEMKWVEME